LNREILAILGRPISNKISAYEMTCFRLGVGIMELLPMVRPNPRHWRRCRGLSPSLVRSRDFSVSESRMAAGQPSGTELVTFVSIGRHGEPYRPLQGVAAQQKHRVGRPARPATLCGFARFDFLPCVPPFVDRPLGARQKTT